MPPEGDSAGSSSSTGGSGETDLTEWSRKVEFLASLWPPEQPHLLAPRVALQCEGSAFQRVARLDPKKLRVGNLEGVKAIVEALGGIWGKSRLEDKFERFERAIYSTVQRADETHESYLARHDHQFEELLSMKLMVTTKHPTSPPTISMIGPRKNGLRVLQMMVTRTPP